VGQTTSGLTTQYVYDMLNVAQEQYTGGSVADMLPGLGLDENFARTDTSGSYAMLPDLLGSTIGLINSTGALGTQYQYGPFGQTTMTGASSTNPIQYTGREMDPSGLYFMRARYYNPIAQRFISPDPIGLLGGQVNLYTYVFNRPMDGTDRLGLIGGSLPPSTGGGGGAPGPANCYGDCPGGSPGVGASMTGGTVSAIYFQGGTIQIVQIEPPQPPPAPPPPSSNPICSGAVFLPALLLGMEVGAYTGFQAGQVAGISIAAGAALATGSPEIFPPVYLVVVPLAKGLGTLGGLVVGGFGPVYGYYEQCI
jgi:RHS repeat-associated protein